MTIEEQTNILEEAILKLIKRFEQDTGTMVDTVMVGHGPPDWAALSVYCDCRSIESKNLYLDFKKERNQSKTKATSFEQWLAEKGNLFRTRGDRKVRD